MLKASLRFSWAIFGCSSAFAGPIEIIDFGNLAGMLAAYLLGFVTLSITLGIAQHRVLKLTALTLYGLAPFFYVAVVSATSHAEHRRLDEERERNRVETEDVFPRFCRERGENLPACDKYRTPIPTEGGGECDANCRLRWQR